MTNYSVSNLNSDYLLNKTVDWTHRHAYMFERHQITPEIVNEVLSDQNAIVFRPDPSSKSGETTRVIGYSLTAGHLVTVILFEADDIIYGVNGWKSDSRDKNRYEGGVQV